MRNFVQKKNCEKLINFILIKQNYDFVPKKIMIVSVSLAQLVGTLYNLCRDRGSNPDTSLLHIIMCELQPLGYLTKKIMINLIIFFLSKIIVTLFRDKLTAT